MRASRAARIVSLAVSALFGCASAADGDPTPENAPVLPASSTEGQPPATTPSEEPDDPAPSALTPTAKSELVDGVLTLQTNVPARIPECNPNVACEDADGDGLVDAWESLVLERLRPRIELDEGEEILKDAKGKIAMVGRVTPRPGSASSVMVYIILAYSRDYGSCGFTSHNGDNERVALELSVKGSDATVRRVYTAAHEGAASDDGHVYADKELVTELRFLEEKGEPRWVVFASRNKHATYANVDRCNAHSMIPCLAEKCAADGVSDVEAFRVLPPIVNAGEPHRHLADDLASLGFPGETAWTTSTFCGGLGGSGCAGGNASKLTTDPF